MNCNGYVSVNMFIKFLSIIIPNKNHDIIGMKDNNDKSKLILSNLFIFLFNFLFFIFRTF